MTHPAEYAAIALAVILACIPICIIGWIAFEHFAKEGHW